MRTGKGVVELLDRLGDVVERFLDVETEELSADDAVELLLGLEARIDRLRAVALTLTAAIERSEAFRRTGHRNVQHLLQDTLRRAAGPAKAQADTARMLSRGELDRTAEALREGEITADHATAIAKAAEKVGDDDPHAEATLLAAARSGDPSQVRRTGDRLSHRSDQRAARRREARRSYEQRTASFRHGPDGSVYFEGRLHQLGGERYLTALDALAAPAGRDDDRSPGQRRADAMVALAEIALRGDRLPDDGGRRPQLLTLIPLETLEERARERGGAPGPATLSWTGPMPPQALDELLCEADLGWLVTDPRGLPLRLGRTSRFASGGQRRALQVRDGGCRWPACDARPEWCIAHHVRYWDEGGSTDLDNLVLVCPAHHATIHHGGWTLHLDDDATVTVRSPGGRITRSEDAATGRARHHHAEGLDARPSGPAVAREVPAHYRLDRAPPTAMRGPHLRTRCRRCPETRARGDPVGRRATGGQTDRSSTFQRPFDQSGPSHPGVGFPPWDSTSALGSDDRHDDGAAVGALPAGGTPRTGRDG